MKAKILLVDDEPDALEVLSYSLKSAGCTTLLAQDGARALAIAKAERVLLQEVFEWHSITSFTESH